MPKYKPDSVRSGNAPFKHNLQQIYDIELGKYLQQQVIIKYWQRFPDIFEGQISCIGSKMQLRLQDIHCLYIDEKSLPPQWHHSYWFHYKNIKSIHFNNNDITDEIMDIMKYQMIRSFLFYCKEECSYSKYTKYIKYLENENVNKILTKLSKDPSNRDLYLECNIPKIFEMAIQNPSRLKVESYHSWRLKRVMQDFLHDLNRINNHLLLKNDLKNKQRISSCFTSSEILRALDQYQHLVIEYVQTLYGIHNCDIKHYAAHVKKHFFDIKDKEDEQWSSYMNWDTKDVNYTLRKWKLYKSTKNRTHDLYDTSYWSNAPTKPPLPSKIRYSKKRIIKRRGAAKNEGLDNKWTSMELHKHFKNRHNNPLHHGKKFKRMKKLHKKRNRIDTEKDAMFMLNQI